MGSLEEVYKGFRGNPKAEGLTSDATVSYVSSGVRFDSPEGVLEHFLKAEYEVELRESVISLHETANSLVLETDTRIKFLRGPGAYLPGLSMNFVADEEATVLMIHIVNFTDDDDRKISSIRYIWDQATLLKQLNVIGARGNSWPICSGTDQIKLTQKGVVRSVDDKNTKSRDMSSPAPFKSWPNQINLFRDPGMDQVPIPQKAAEAPSPSAKPPLRSFQEMLNLNDDGTEKKQPQTPPPPQPRYSVSNRPVRTSNMRARPQSAVMTLFGSMDDDDNDSNEQYTRIVGSGAANPGAKAASWRDWN